MSNRPCKLWRLALALLLAAALPAPAGALETAFSIAGDEEFLEIVEAAIVADAGQPDLEQRFAKDFVILFIPGILGSVLETSDGTQIWGSGRPAVGRLALTATPEYAATTRVQAQYPLGLLSPDIYGDFDTNYLSIDGSQRALEFSYDWRHDIDRIADRLEQRIRGPWAEVLRDKQLIVIAHSMGGLVAWSWKNRYYQAEGADYDFKWYRLLLLGSPLGGSCDMLRMLLDGYQPGGETRMEKLFKLFFSDLRAAAFTFPSVFQLLPRFDEADKLGVCLKRQGVNRDPQDHFSLKVWRDLLSDFLAGDPWWHPFGQASVWQDLQLQEEGFWRLVETRLEAARRFRDDLDLAEGDNMAGRVLYYYSNAHHTTRTLLFDGEGSTGLERQRGDGDGRVLSASATLDRYAEGNSHSLRLTHGDLPSDDNFLLQLGDLVRTLKKQIAVRAAKRSPAIRQELAARRVLVPMAAEDWTDGPEAAAVADLVELNRATLAAVAAERPELAWDGTATGMVRLVSTLEEQGAIGPGAVRPLLELAWLEGSRDEPAGSVLLAQRLAQKLEEASVFGPAARVARAGLSSLGQAPDVLPASYERDLHYRLGSSLEALGAEDSAQQSYRQAFQVAEAQAASGLAGADEAMVWLGRHYAHGLGVERDPVAAIAWYTRAVESASNPWAKANLGLAQLASATIEDDPAKARSAVELFNEALASDRFRSAASATHFGEVYSNLGRALLVIGEDPSEEFALANQKLRLAWDGGDAKAAFLLGQMYQEGQGQSRDYALAADWYKRAGTRGQVGAMQRLAQLYDADQLPGGKEQALNWYLQAASRGDVTSMLQSGFRFETGLGTARNTDTAAYWYRRALLAGAPEASSYLARLEHETNQRILEQGLPAPDIPERE